MPRATHPSLCHRLVAARSALLLALLLCAAPPTAHADPGRAPDMTDMARRFAAADQRAALPRPPADPAEPRNPSDPSVPADPAADRDPADAAIAARENLPLTGVAPADASASAANRTSAAAPSHTMSVGWARTAGALVLVITLIFLLRAVVRRLTPGSGGAGRLGATVHVLGRTPLGPRHSLMLLRVGQRILVVADAAGAMRTLSEINDPQEVADLLAEVSRAQAGSASRAFDHLLGRMNSDYEQIDADLEGADDAEFHTDRARDRVGSLLSRLRSIVRQPLGAPADFPRPVAADTQPPRTPRPETRA
jgi:flagellar biogenesis protein FliO